MSKHTPAPWIVKKWETETYKGCEIMNLEGVSVSYISNLNWEANAKLIAAAPELLEALKRALHDFRKMTWTDETYNIIEATIKKATL